MYIDLETLRDKERERENVNLLVILVVHFFWYRQSGSVLVSSHFLEYTRKHFDISQIKQYKECANMINKEEEKPAFFLR